MWSSISLLRGHYPHSWEVWGLCPVLKVKNSPKVSATLLLNTSSWISSYINFSTVCIFLTQFAANWRFLIIILKGRALFCLKSHSVTSASTLKYLCHLLYRAEVLQWLPSWKRCEKSLSISHMKCLVTIIGTRTEIRVQPYTVQMAGLNRGDIFYFANTWLHELVPIETK